MTLLRWLTIVSLGIWQGGFFFYVTFVVPTGTDVLGSAFEQGRITYVVTGQLNLVAVGALTVLAIEAIASRARGRWAWLVFASVCQVALFIIRPMVAEQVDWAQGGFVDYGSFYLRHRIYLWVHTAQWVAMLGYAYACVRVWHKEPRTE